MASRLLSNITKSGTAPAVEAKRCCVGHALYDTATDAILRSNYSIEVAAGTPKLKRGNHYRL
ncbi:hypothetical protein ACWGMO_12415, partial [Nocardia salmonicida]